jgi:hypothetical protein
MLSSDLPQMGIVQFCQSLMHHDMTGRQMRGKGPPMFALDGHNAVGVDTAGVCLNSRGEVEGMRKT